MSAPRRAPCHSPRRHGRSTSVSRPAGPAVGTSESGQKEPYSTASPHDRCTLDCGRSGEAGTRCQGRVTAPIISGCAQNNICVRRRFTRDQPLRHGHWNHRIASALIASCCCAGTGQSMILGGDFVLENVDQMKALLTWPDRSRAREAGRVPDGGTIAIEMRSWRMRLSVFRCPWASPVVTCYRENLELRPVYSL